METIYLFRHSRTLNTNNIKTHEEYQTINEKLSLSINGELLAKTVMSNSEFKNIDEVFSSNYVRAIGTAKYLADSNAKIVNIISDFGERKFGVKEIKDLPEKFEERQFEDENYKLPEGESRKEVKERMYKALMNILDLYKGKRIAIVSHGTALSCLLSNWCEIAYQGPYKFNGKIFFDGKWNYCEAFKLIFDNNNLKSIEVVPRKEYKVEISMPVSKSIDEIVEMLLKNGCKNGYNGEVHDIYYTNQKLDGLSENEMKKACVRIRKYREYQSNGKWDISVQNKDILIEDIKSISSIEEMINKLEDNGYKKVFDTKKTDLHYIIPNCKGDIQLQYVEDIGNLVYYYNEELFGINEYEQRRRLIDELNSVGFDFNYEDYGLDKLRTLYYGIEEYSLNQDA